MTTETLDNRIKELQDEQAQLTSSYEKVTRDYQKIVSAKQTRYAQITGALTELETLKKQLNGASEP